jgi:hypothetical protein
MPFVKPTKEARDRAKARRLATQERMRTQAREEAVRACFAYVAFGAGAPTAQQKRAFAGYLARNGCSSSVVLGRAKVDLVAEDGLSRLLRKFLTACRPAMAERRKIVRDLRTFARLDGVISDEAERGVNVIAALLKVATPTRERPTAGTAFKKPRPREETPRCYEILGCSVDDSDDVIKRRYRQLAAKLHPDKHASKMQSREDAARHTAEFQQLQSAYEEIRRLRQRGKP